MPVASGYLPGRSMTPRAFSRPSRQRGPNMETDRYVRLTPSQRREYARRQREQTYEQFRLSERRRIQHLVRQRRPA